MTKQEAIEEIQMSYDISEDTREMAIEALQAQDALEDIIDNVNWYHINRQGELVSGADGEGNALYKAEDVYKALGLLEEPKTAQSGSNNPEQGDYHSDRTTDDCISRQGEWIPYQYGENDMEAFLGWTYCSICGKEGHSRTSYCPYCGARMESDTE